MRRNTIQTMLMAHIGNMIQRELDRQHLSRTWLAKTIYCSRPNVNKILSRSYINTDSLLLISRALNHNFFADLAIDYDSGDEAQTPLYP